MTRDLLNTNWEVLFEGLNTEKMWLLFHSKLLFLIDNMFLLKRLNLILNLSG